MRTLTEADLRRLLHPAELITALETAFRDRYPRVQMPTRMQIPLTGGVFLLMPCYDPDTDKLGIKSVIVQNHPARPEERVQASYELYDGATGKPSLSMDAKYLTDIRTAATSALATRYLARNDARVLGIFGTGRQARAHAAVLPLVRSFERVLVSGHTPASARKFAEIISAETEIPCEPASAAACAAESDVICTCTTSGAPLFDDDLLRPGTHLNLVGAYQPHTREVDSRTIRRSRVFIDTYDGAFAEAGDLLIPIAERAIGRDHILADLHELTSSTVPGRVSRDEITVFKSVGCALEDLVAAEVIQQALSDDDLSCYNQNSAYGVEES